MKQTRRVPFDIEKAKQGAKVVTKDGNPVRIVSYDRKSLSGDFPICALIDVGEYEMDLFFREDGTRNDEIYDLFIEEEVENDSKNQDETIRKALISYFQYFPYNSLADSGLNAKDVIAWLEKQGEQETLCDKCKKLQPSHSCQDITALGRCAVEHEQKTTDKFEIKPKFHKGDWVIDKQGTVHQIANVIENVTNHTYGYDVVGGGYFNENVEGIRFWTIQDARNGIVLACDTCIVLFKEIDGLNIKCHCTYHFMDTPMFFVDTLQNKTAFYPAIKEQRDLLFQKMKEAGYEWNADKKELKKIGEEAKTRRMTNQELSWWLRECHEEHREFCFDEGCSSHSFYDYCLDFASEEVAENIRIRKNGGEWQEPLVEE